MTSRRPRKATLKIDLAVQSDLWADEPQAKSMVRKAIRAATRFSARDLAGSEVCVVLADDRLIRALNREWRGQDKPTNVLSFPAAKSKTKSGAPASLGDIIIAFETLKREAAEQRKPFLHHLAHLSVHGFLHLCGYDHENNGEAEAMEAAERVILAHLGIPDPYASTPLSRAIKARA